MWNVVHSVLNLANKFRAYACFQTKKSKFSRITYLGCILRVTLHDKDLLHYLNCNFSLWMDLLYVNRHCAVRRLGFTAKWTFFHFIWCQSSRINVFKFFFELFWQEKNLIKIIFQKKFSFFLLMSWGDVTFGNYKSVKRN